MNTRTCDETTLNREEVRAWFKEWGYSVPQWARSHGIDPMAVRNVLDKNKNIKGVRGEAHKAMVLLNMKKGMVELKADALPRPSKVEEGQV